MTELEGKTAVIYGGGGALGGAVSLQMARAGAVVYLVGRSSGPLEKTAAQIRAAGGTVHIDTFDATQRDGVNAHIEKVLSETGSVDISINLTSRGDVQGTPLLDMASEDFMKPFSSGFLSNVLTAQAAGRAMVENGGGVVIYLTSASSNASTPLMGSTAAADAATESFMKQLSVEIGPSKVRVVGIWTAGVVDALSPDLRNSVFSDPGEPSMDGLTLAEYLAAKSALRRSPMKADIANAAVFIASDRAAAITGSIINVTAGLSIG